MSPVHVLQMSPVHVLQMSPVHVLQMSPVQVLQNESSPCFTNESSPGFTSPVQSMFYNMPSAGTKQYCIWFRASSSKLSNHLPVFLLKRQFYIESSNEMTIPGIRSFLKAWPVTGNL